MRARCRLSSLSTRAPSLFVLIRTAPATGDPLREGQSVKVRGNDAVLVTGLSGSVSPPADLGTLPAASSERYSVTYEDASALIWVTGDTLVEILSNLPMEELQKVAEGLVPED